MSGTPNTGKFATMANLPTAEWLNKQHEWLNKQYEKIVEKESVRIELAINIGEVLYTVQEKNKGKFIKWLEDNIRFSQRSVYRYIALYNFKDNIHNVKNLMQAYRIIDKLMTQKKEINDEKAYQRVEIYNKTGVKSKDWRKNTDDRLAKKKREQVTNDKLVKKETTSKTEIIIPTKEEVKRKLVHLDHSKPKKQEPEIKKPPENKNDPIIDVLMDYINELPNKSLKITVCRNIMDVCRKVIDDILDN